MRGCKQAAECAIFLARCEDGTAAYAIANGLQLHCVNYCGANITQCQCYVKADPVLMERAYAKAS